MGLNVYETEAVAVKKLLTRLTGAPYRVSDPPKGFPHQPKWFVWCPDSYYIAKTAHVWAVWSDGRDEIKLESSDLDDTTELVLTDYGEKGAAKAMDFGYAIAPEEVVRTELAKEFPLLHERLKRYDEILAGVSSKTRIRLALLFEGGGSLAWIKLGATVRRSSGWEANENAITLAVGALKEAYDLLCKAEA